MLSSIVLAAASAARWDLPWCAGSEHWFCRTHTELQGLNPSHLVMMVIPFWITVFVVWNKAIKPLLHVIEEREARTEGARAEAADFEAKFNERLKAYEARVAEARQKASDERGRIRAGATAEVDKILTAAREDATKAIEQVRAGITVERTKAADDLKKQAESLAAELAGKALGRDLAGTSAASRPAGARTEARS